MSKSKAPHSFFRKTSSLAYKTFATLLEIALLPLDVASQATFYPERFYSSYSNLPAARKRFKSQQEMKQGIRKLQDSKLIHALPDGSFELTPKLMREIVRYKIRAKLEQLWDGKWRIIIYDVPEISRKERDFLRSQLKLMGFYEIQKSVWIYPFEIQDELQAFINLCEVHLSGDLRFITAEYISREEEIKKFFGLK